MLQFIAREIGTLETKSCLAVYNNFAGFDFTYHSCNRLAVIWAMATRAFILFPEKGIADSAIHAAGCDK